MSRYEEYIARICKNGKCDPEQAHQSAISRAVEKYYETEPETAPRVRNEFNCLSET